MNQPVELYDKQELEAHPFADAFPLIEGAEFDELVQSVAKNGVLQPIMIFQGLILDGRNRYRALKASGFALTKADVLEFEGSEEDAREYVRLQNINRRHLTPSQRAIAAVRLDGGKSAQRSLADGHGLALGAIHKANVVVTQAKPHIADMAERGEITLQDAHKVAHLPKREQAKLKTPDKVKAAAAKMARKQAAESDAERGYTRNRINAVIGQFHRLATVDPATIIRRLSPDDREALREIMPTFGAFLLNLSAALDAPIKPDGRVAANDGADDAEAASA